MIQDTQHHKGNQLAFSKLCALFSESIKKKTSTDKMSSPKNGRLHKLRLGIESTVLRKLTNLFQTNE